MIDKFPICNGQTWKTTKETFAHTIQIIKVSNGNVKAAFYTNSGEVRDDKVLTVEQFIQILSDGEYVLDYSPPRSGVEPVLKLSKSEDTGKKYLRTIRSKKQRGPDGKLLTIEADVYCVIDGFGPFSAAMNHAIKKVLCPGLRGSKDKITDLKEAIVSIQHEIESEMEFAPEPEKPKPTEKKVIKPPPEDKLPPFVQKGDMIYVGDHYRTENGHEFYDYRAKRGSGVRSETHEFTACRFCGQLIESYDEKSTCPKLNSP